MKLSHILLSALFCAGVAACTPNKGESHDGASAETKLPYIGQREGINTHVSADGKTVTDTVYHTVPDFHVTNQDGEPMSAKDLDGNVYVADFFFTSCPTICPITEPNMLRVQQAFKAVPDFKLISFSIDPDHDKPAVLKDYAGKLGADTKQWSFVNGDADQIYELAQKGYLASAQKDKTAPGGFLHSGAFVLVDKEKHIRGVYNGTDSAEVNRLIRDIPKLFREYHETVKAQ